MSEMMSIAKAVLKRCGDFRGRSSRSEFGWGSLFLILTFLFFQFSRVFLVGWLRGFGSINDFNIWIRTFINVYFMITAVIMPWFLIITFVNLWIRRMHDVNRRGFWLLLIPVAPATIWVFRRLFQQGDSGHNEYGAPPSEEGIEVGHPLSEESEAELS